MIEFPIIVGVLGWAVLLLILILFLLLLNLLKNLKTYSLIGYFICRFNYLCGSINYYIDKKNVRAMAAKEMPLVDIKEMAIYTGLSLIMKGMSVSPLKLQKILYYEQSWHMVFFGRENTLFEDIPQAWVNGPVYPSIYHEYRYKVANMCDHLKVEHFTDGDIHSKMESIVSKNGWDSETVELLDSIIMLYGSKTQNQLIFLTHAEMPWTEARKELPPYASSQNPISLDTMHSYYKARRERKKSQQ